MAIRVAVVGPRRRREGLGPFLIQYLLQHGAKLVAVATSRGETAQLAVEEIHRRWGIRPRGYASVGEMVSRERLDAVVICSPTRLHLQHLQMAATVGLHVLCEKPLCFDGKHSPALAVRGMLHQFQREGRVLMVNHPWPYTLAAHRRLYPQALVSGTAARDVQVWLAPSCTGVEMIPHAFTHALSLLQAVSSAQGRILHLDVRPRADAAGTVRGWDIAFLYGHAQGSTVFRTRLVHQPRQPRQAGYAIDLQWVRRRILWPQYRQYLEPGHPEQAPAPLSGPPGAQAVELEDPLSLLVADFLRRCKQGGMDRRDYKLVLTQLGMLWMVWEAACRAVGQSPPAAREETLPPISREETRDFDPLFARKSKHEPFSTPSPSTDAQGTAKDGRHSRIPRL